MFTDLDVQLCVYLSQGSPFSDSRWAGEVMNSHGPSDSSSAVQTQSHCQGTDHLIRVLE